MNAHWISKLRSPIGQAAFGSIGLILLTFIAFRLGLNLATAGFVFLVLLSGFSLLDDWRISAILCIVAIGSLNYFFARPIFSFWVENPQDIVALTAFVVVILIIAWLQAKRRRGAAALQKSEIYLAEAQRVSHTGSLGWNPLSGEVFWSDETFRILAYDLTQSPSLEALLQRTHPDDRSGLQADLERAVRKEAATCERSFRLLMSDRPVKYLLLVGHVAKSASGDSDFVGALMDITDMRRAEDARLQAQAELARVNRVILLGEITTSIAHEVNQPIAATVTNANACTRFLGAQPPDIGSARLALTRIVRDSNRAADVISRIRDLTRRAPPQTDLLDVNKAILDVFELIESDLDRYRVRLQYQLSADLPLVRADRVQVQQVILNLLVNGIEAMSCLAESPRALFVGSRRDNESGILVEVRDTGVGLPSDDSDRLFESFYTTKPQGMGMGLVISRSIIEAHGGRLWATPNKPHGAIFTFTLPLDEQPSLDAARLS
jgi:C4-dicarboxylate-specific signal transduction histidine kinase